MIFFASQDILSFLLDRITVVGRADRDKDIEIMLLRQQLRILQRKLNQSPRISRGEKLLLAVLTMKLVRLARTSQVRLRQSLVLFTPETVLKWHRELVRRKWTFRQRRVPGRPQIAPDLEALILRLAQENPRWGYSKIHGELYKLGYRVSRSTVRNVLKRRKIPPTSYRAPNSS